MKGCVLFFCIAGFFVSHVKAFSVIHETTTNKYKTILATACDSLIKANENNPNFVILDVRTPDVWKSDHLSGSINRNYYDTDFSTQLNALPKNKIFLLHCQSGGRSISTLATMKNLNFAEVYEMKGGINAWKSSSLPTTNILGSKLMLVSNGDVKYRTIQYGVADTLKFTLTNRANDTLKFVSVTLPEGNEFASNFDLKKKLKGSDDYTFSIYYKPQQLSKDSVHVAIKSNGGDLNLKIVLKIGTVLEVQTFSRNEPKIYPNPASGFIIFENIFGKTIQELSLINMNGQTVKKEFNFSTLNQLNVATLPRGIYFVRILSGKQTFVKKLILNW